MGTLSRKTKNRIADVKVEFYEGELFELEVFVAKKSSNLSELYERISTLLKDPRSKINGYSLYEVEGDWRSKIEISKDNKNDFKILESLKSKHGKGSFKDLIRPIITKGEEKFVVFDESSIVLKIIIQTVEKIDWNDPDNHLIRELKEIFREITKNEKSIFFTLKELKRVGSISRPSRPKDR